MLFRPASVAPGQRTAACIQGGPSNCCRPAPLLPAQPGCSLAFPGSHQRGTRAPSLPAAAEGRERVCCFSLFLSAAHRLAAHRLHSPDGNPTRLSRPLLQGPRSRLICLCPDRGKEEEEKPQTSFANQFAARAWSARRRLSRSGTLKTPEAPGAPGCPLPAPSPSPACPRPHPSPACPGLAVSPEVATTQAGRRARKAVSSRGSSEADSWEAAGAGGAPRLCPLLPRRAARIESSPTPGNASTPLR